jgi:hypothetical protein
MNAAAGVGCLGHGRIPEVGNLAYGLEVSPEARMWGRGAVEGFSLYYVCRMMMMPFICSCRNKIGAELHIYLEEGTYHKRLFRGLTTNAMKK